MSGACAAGRGGACRLLTSASPLPPRSFLFEVQRHAAVNKMNVENLATVMGINLLKPQIEDPFTMMKGGGKCTHTHAHAHARTHTVVCSPQGTGHFFRNYTLEIYRSLHFPNVDFLLAQRWVSHVTSQGVEPFQQTKQMLSLSFFLCCTSVDLERRKGHLSIFLLMLFLIFHLILTLRLVLQRFQRF